MQYNKIIKNPFLLFLPFLIIYVVIVFISPTEAKFGDETRYLIYAKHMLNWDSQYLDPNFEILGNGPGYSIILTPFLALGLPLICIALFNAVLFYFSTILLFKTLSRFASFRKTMLVCLFWSCYLNLYECMVRILPETFVAFLICLLIYVLSKAFYEVKYKKYVFFSGFIIGYIALTKPIFGYVLSVVLIATLIIWLLKRNSINHKRMLIILSISFCTTIPYLIYTYSLTNKVFYWSTFGGNNLYWMTSLSPNEYGNWFQDVNTDPTRSIATMDTTASIGLGSRYNDYIIADHRKDYEELNKFSGSQQDSVYKAIAMRNIKSNPVKFFKNCISNVGRIVFNFPYSYKLEDPRTLIRLPFNGTILVLMFLSFFPAIKNWRRIDYPYRFLLLFTFVYLGGSVLGSAETRIFTVIVPILLVWIAYIVQRTIKLSVKQWW